MSTSQIPALRIPSSEKRLKPPKSLDWLGRLLDVAKVVTSIPFPYVKAVAGTIVVLLETIEVRPGSFNPRRSAHSSHKGLGKNKDDMRILLESVIDIVVVVRDDLLAQGDLSGPGYKEMCLDFNECGDTHQNYPRC
jgi:hypothetical protein